ncbi:phenylalanine--tRNA ligase subunit beta [Roseateles sp. BYS180W]|uniref:Phenylalanine--tRNA ligase beta subunit n=1 Tax=Roseateles rivi TaxID=3299028 RepID=A0ABW7FXJ7_9BURK
MQFPESWLRSYCNPSLTTQELSHLLTMSGMEVEEARAVAPPFTGVVVAEILEAQPHPNADKLRVCQVNVGGSQPLQIVCGAPNARAGIRVPLATVGAVLPPGADGKPFKIGVGKLRGVESSGMLCSARELGLSDEHGGLLELAADAPVGQDIREHLQLDDTLFTLKLTPNLGHCLSVYGIAREVAALTGAPLQQPKIAPVAVQHQDRLPVQVQATDLCGRFAGRIVRGVNARATTPEWMVQRLARCGQRSVSALVDISNYVMFELGRPSHMFDLAKIDGGLVVRWAHEGEQLELLNGNTVALDGKVGVIADARRVESLAGIMGGAYTAVSDDTQDIYIEAAFWWPEAVMGRARRYNFSTDAGHRFERGVDAQHIAEHIEYITALVLQICGGQVGPLDDQSLQLPERPAVKLRVARAAKVIGLPLSAAEVEGVLQRLGLAFEALPDGVYSVTPPSWRFDLQIEEDLIEEVIRVLGYERLPATPPLAPVVARVGSEARLGVHALRHAVAARDYFETINFSFVEERWERELAGNETPIRLHNPIASQLSVMRTSLMGSLVQVLRHNLARKAPRVRVFEIGRVFLRDSAAQTGPVGVQGVTQPLRLAGLAWGGAEQLQWGQRERAVDFYDVKGDLEALFAPRTLRFEPAQHPALHPGRCARVFLGDQDIGVLGELHPRWRQAYELPAAPGAPVLFELALDAVLAGQLPQGQPVPRQQAVQRDLALIVGEAVSHEALMQAIQGAGEVLVRSAKLFDVFKPAQATAELKAGERSLAVRLELRDDDATLTDERIEQAVAAVVRQLGEKLGARLRG